MACYDWKLHSKPSTTILLHVYVVKSDLILVKILKFLDFKKITLAFLVLNGGKSYLPRPLFPRKGETLHKANWGQITPTLQL